MFKCFLWEEWPMSFISALISFHISFFFQIEKLGDTYYLVKRNAVVADTGKYICLATNELGQAHCSAFIRVIGKWT